MRKRRLWLFCLAVLGAAPAPKTAPEPADNTAPAGDTVRLRGQYVVSLMGITVGRGSWDVRIAPDHYIATGNGRSAGLAVLISSGHGEASADGAMQDGIPAPRRYDYASTTSKKYDDVHFTLANGTVGDLHIEPPIGRNRKRIPVLEAHQEGVTDPIAGVLIPSKLPPGPQSCARRVPVFDGRMRYDLQFSFLRIEQVKTEKGYAGPVAVCRLRFIPIAGYVPDRPAIKYLAALETMEAWLAPVTGANLVVPWKVVIPTPFGTAEMEAESFHVTQQ